MRLLRYLWRHPRRTGFLLFNLAVIVVLFAWWGFTQRMAHEGIAGVPNVILGYTGMALIWAALVCGWIAWAVMVASRHPPAGRSAER
jgi:hypothetical protein